MTTDIEILRMVHDIVMNLVGTGSLKADNVAEVTKELLEAFEIGAHTHQKDSDDSASTQEEYWRTAAQTTSNYRVVSLTDSGRPSTICFTNSMVNAMDVARLLSSEIAFAYKVVDLKDNSYVIAYYNGKDLLEEPKEVQV